MTAPNRKAGGGFRILVVPKDQFEAWFPQARAVRREVFVQEQSVPEDLELDGQDRLCRHVLVYASAGPNPTATSEASDPTAAGRPVGTARLRPLPAAGGAPSMPKVAKVERVAVRAPYRSRGAGGMLMDAIEALAQDQGFTELVLSAQAGVIDWYARRGYTPEGPRFMEAGIEHQKMSRPLPHKA